MTGSADLDDDVLRQLRDLALEGEDDPLPEIMEIFLRDTAERVRHVREAVAHRDASALQSVAHSLKGSAGTFGAITVRNLSAELERIGRDGTVHGATPLLLELEAAAERTRQALHSRLEQQGQAT
jgi:HPt (histidine-containing phosphotransfer) domain-containing protein